MTAAEEIRNAANEEYRQELFREAVEKYKEQLRTRKSFWDRVFPYKLIVIKKGKKYV